MKKLSKYSVFIVILVLVYFLFEPIIVFNIGKKTLPKLNHLEVVNSSNFEKADELLKKEFIKLKTPALSVAVGMNNKIVWSNTIGYVDIAQKVLADSLTKFRIGSSSKALTSAGTGVLIQQNKLKLDSQVKDFVPYAKGDLGNLTLGQIASHTSGIRNYGICACFPIWEYYNNDEYESIKESVNIFNGDEILFEPGTDFSYSSYNYTLLSAMIEGASNKNFIDFMNDNVFKPLHLNQTMADIKYTTETNIAKFYDVENENYKEAYNVNNSNKWAGGGFLSTPNDLVKFGNAILNNKLLDSSTTTMILTPITLKNGEINKQNYAMGWRNDKIENIFNDKRKINVIHHGGMAMGSTALLILLPQYNMSIAVTINRGSQSFDLFDTAYKFGKLFIINE